MVYNLGKCQSFEMPYPNMEAHCPYNNQPCGTIHGGQLAPADVFFAYPSQPDARVETMQGAIGRFRESRGCDSAIDWSELAVEGSVIFCAICEAIRSSSCVIADISGLNFNVLFEFGFAVGCGKPVWPLIEDSKQEIRTYSAFKSLSNIGYSRYRNSKMIVQKLGKKRPWNRKPQLQRPTMLNGEPSGDATSVLYLKSPHDDEPSLRITEALTRPRIDLIIDDPNEIAFQPITWHLSKLETSFAVVIDLGSRPDMVDREYHAKCALIAGIAVASGRQLLLCGPKWNTAPIDYAILYREYKTAAQAALIASTFADQLEAASAVFERHESTALTPLPAKDLPLPSRVSVGEYKAEDELPDLGSYFVESPQSISLLDDGFKIIVGRKGTGKSALAHITRDKLEEQKKTAVRVITPKGYELEQVLRVVKGTNLPLGGSVVGALWRYAIGTEALAAVWEKIENRVVDDSWSQSEARIRETIESYEGLTELSFASRIALLARRQGIQLDPEDNVPEGKLLGQLQRTQLRQLRDLVCDFLTLEDWRLVIVIDDIVPRWTSVEERIEYGEVLLSFFEAARDLWREWNRYVTRHNGRPLSMLVFVRSDIFSSMLSNEQEPDRISHENLQWEDVESLLDLVARRMDASVPEQRLYWPDILDEDLSVEMLRQFVHTSILYRPRDMIFFFSRVLFHADRRRAKAIGRRDLRVALTDYSEYAFKALAAEWCPQIPNVGDLLVDFFGGPDKLSDEELRDQLVRNNIAQDNIEEAIRFLVDSQFLGIAIDENNFRYAMTPMQGDIMMRQAKRFVSRQGGSNRFQIHRAFHHSLALD